MIRTQLAKDALSAGVRTRSENKVTSNLSVQIDKLSAAGYIEVEKTFKGKRPCTICRMTDKGRQAFEEYVEALKSYLTVAT